MQCPPEGVRYMNRNQSPRAIFSLQKFGFFIRFFTEHTWHPIDIRTASKPAPQLDFKKASG
jgi:hypothetical protein